MGLGMTVSPITQSYYVISKNVKMKNGRGARAMGHTGVDAAEAKVTMKRGGRSHLVRAVLRMVP